MIVNQTYQINYQIGETDQFKLFQVEHLSTKNKYIFVQFLEQLTPFHLNDDETLYLKVIDEGLFEDKPYLVTEYFNGHIKFSLDTLDYYDFIDFSWTVLSSSITEFPKPTTVLMNGFNTIKLLPFTLEKSTRSVKESIALLWIQFLVADRMLDQLHSNFTDILGHISTYYPEESPIINALLQNETVDLSPLIFNQLNRKKTRDIEKNILFSFHENNPVSLILSDERESFIKLAQNLSLSFRKDEHLFLPYYCDLNKKRDHQFIHFLVHFLFKKYSEEIQKHPDFNGYIKDYFIDEKLLIAEPSHLESDEPLFIMNMLYLVQHIVPKEPCVILIDKLELLDDLSLQFISQCAQSLNHFKFVLGCKVRHAHKFQKRFRVGHESLHQLTTYGFNDLSEFFKRYFYLNETNSSILSQHLLDKTGGKFQLTEIFINWCLRQNITITESKTLSISNLNYIKQIQSESVIWESKLTRFDTYKELLLFLAFIQRPVPVTLILNTFNNSSQMNFIFYSLFNDYLLDYYYSDQLKVILKCFKLRKQIVSWFEDDVTEAVINHLLECAPLMPYLDEPLMSAIMTNKEKSNELIRVKNTFLDFATQRNFIREEIRLLFDLTELNKKIKNEKPQLYDELGDKLTTIKNHQLAVEQYESYASLVENDTNVWLKIAECYLEMDRYDIFEQIIKNDALQELSNQSDNKIILLKSKVLQCKKRYDEILAMFPEDFEIPFEDRNELIQMLYITIESFEQTHQIETLIKHLNYYLDQFKQRGWLPFQRVLYYYLGKSYYKQREFTKSIVVLKKSIEIAQKIHDETLVAQISHLIGVIHQLNGNNRDALDYYIRSIQLYLLYDNEHLAAINYTFLSNVYRDLGFIEKSIQSEKYAYDLFRKKSNHEEMIYSLLSITHNFLLIYNHSKAEKNLNEAIRYSRSIKSSECLARCYLFLSYMASQKQQFKKANLYLIDALNLIEDREEDNYINFMYYKAFYEWKSGNLIEAKSIAISSFNTKILKENKKYQATFSLLMAEILIDMKDLKTAEKFVEKSIVQSEKQDNLIWFLRGQITSCRLYHTYKPSKYYIAFEKGKKMIPKIIDRIEDTISAKTFKESTQISTFLNAKGTNEYYW